MLFAEVAASTAKLRTEKRKNFGAPVMHIMDRRLRRSPRSNIRLQSHGGAQSCRHLGPPRRKAVNFKRETHQSSHSLDSASSFNHHGRYIRWTARWQLVAIVCCCCEIQKIYAHSLLPPPGHTGGTTTATTHLRGQTAQNVVELSASRHQPYPTTQGIKSMPFLTYIGEPYDTNASSKFPLGECEGDCDR